MKYLTKTPSWTPASSKTSPDLSMFAGDFFLPTSLKRRDRSIWSRTCNMQFDVLKVLRPSGEKWRYYFPSYCAAFFRTCFHDKELIIIYHCIQVILGNISYIVNDRKQKEWYKFQQIVFDIVYFDSFFYIKNYHRDDWIIKIIIKSITSGKIYNIMTEMNLQSIFTI